MLYATQTKFSVSCPIRYYKVHVRKGHSWFWYLISHLNSHTPTTGRQSSHVIMSHIKSIQTVREWENSCFCGKDGTRYQETRCLCDLQSMQTPNHDLDGVIQSITWISKIHTGGLYVHTRGDEKQTLHGLNIKEVILSHPCSYSCNNMCKSEYGSLWSCTLLSDPWSVCC